MIYLTPNETAKACEALDDVAATCDRVDGADAPEDAERLATAAESAERSIRSMRARLTGLILSRELCNEPPDAAGLCLRCGKRRADVVAMDPHRPCLGTWVLWVGRPIVRCTRVVRMIREELRR